MLTVGGWTLASRLLGFVRDILIAALAGAGPVADAFFVANKLPNMFRRLFGEGAFNAAFVPEFAGLLHSEGSEAARAFAREAFSVLAFWLLLLTFAGELAMPWLMLGLAPGFHQDLSKFQLATDLARIAFPYLLLICLCAMLSGILNGMSLFVASGAAQVIYNCVSIAAMLLLTRFVPTVGHALAWGVSAAGVAQLALLGWAVRRAGMPLGLPRPRLTPRMRSLLRRIAPGVLGASAAQLNAAVDVVIGSLLPAGTVSVLYYADRLNQLPLGVIGTAVGTALLPTLSRHVHAGDAPAAAAAQSRAIEVALLLTLPASLALITCGHPIVSVLFVRGAFTEDAARLSAQALAAFAAGLPAIVLVKVLAPAFFARGDTVRPVRIGIAALVLNLALNLAFMTRLAHVGPPAASSVSSIANAALLALGLHRRGWLGVDARLRRRWPRMLGAAGVMVGVLLAANALLDPIGRSGSARFLSLGVLVGVGLTAYLGAALALGALDVPRRRRRPPLLDTPATSARSPAP